MQAVKTRSGQKIHAAYEHSGSTLCNSRPTNLYAVSTRNLATTPESHFCEKCFAGGKQHALKFFSGEVL